MRRRSKAGGKPPKTQGRKTLKRRNAAKAVVRRSSSAVSQETNVAVLTRERDEALEQLSATSEVLRVISCSPGDLEPVFASMLENAIRLCGANSGSIYRRDGDVFDLVAAHNLPPAFADYRRHFPISTNEKTSTGRMVLTKTVAHVADAAR